MIQLRRSGSIADVIAEARDVAARVVPYAAAEALTKCAKLGRARVQAVMPQAFRAPTRYTLNALRIVPATKGKLSASVAVKDQAAGGSTRPESYLLPGVEGGKRSEKRFERALRYAGALPRGMYALPGSAAKLDASGNLSRATVQQILTAVKGIRSASNSINPVTGKKRRAGHQLLNDVFVGQPSVGRGKGRRVRPGAASGVWRREGKRLRPLLIFTRQAPDYRQRLDFDATVSAVVRERFAVEFAASAASISSRFAAR